MKTLAIELNDAGIVAVGEQGLLAGPSPGYALLDAGELVVGAKARAAARSKPRWVDNRFWDRLDTVPLRRPFPRSLSRADLAHAHLSELWQSLQAELRESAGTVSVLLAAPGSFSNRQLGLLLGIARACEIPVTGMVDSALAAVARAGPAGRALHLDVLLHRAVWTELEHDGELLRRRVEVLDGVGLAPLWDASAKLVAELFVRQTRFDPFHHGSAEQAMYDLLPTWLATVGRDGRAIASLESGGKERTVELTAARAEAAAESLISPIVELAGALIRTDRPASVCLSERAADIPGLLQRLSEVSDTELRILGVEAAAAGTLDHRERIEAPGGELPFVVRLPLDRQPDASGGVVIAPPKTRPAESSGPRPTHLLLDGIAHPLTGEPFFLGTSIPAGARGINLSGSTAGVSRSHCSVYRHKERVVIDDHSSYGTYLNGRRIAGSADAAVGDRLRLGSPGIELQLIAAAGEDG